MKAFSTIYSSLENKLLEDGCTVSRFQIMFYLYFDGPHRAIDIANKMIVSRGNITSFLRRLEKDEIIKAVYKKNEKRPSYTLTSNGKYFFESLFPKHLERVMKMTPSLNKKTIHQLLSVEKLN